jgi:hypothetical protein
MNSFNAKGRLERQCIGVITDSYFKSEWVIYIKDEVGGRAKNYIAVSFEYAKTKEIAIREAKKLALSKGINLVEVY